MDTIISTFTAENPVSQTFLIEGIRGSGKTVLMTIVENELASRGDWAVIDLNSTRDLIADLAMRLSDEYHRLGLTLKSGFNVSLAGIGVGLNGNPQHNDLSIIAEILTALKNKKKRMGSDR